MMPLQEICLSNHAILGIIFDFSAW